MMLSDDLAIRDSIITQHNCLPSPETEIHFGYNIVIGIPITNDSKKGLVGVPFAIASCGCRASVVHPIETVRRLPNLLQRLFLMKQNLLISVPHFHSP